MHVILKSFNSVGTKFRGLMGMDMFMDTEFVDFQIVHKISYILYLNKYFIGVFNSWIKNPTEYINKMSNK